MRPRQLWNNLPVAATAARAGRSLALAASLVLAVAAALAYLRFSRYTVRGPSMEPALYDGDRLLVLRSAYWFCAPRPGEIVLARPHALAGREVVKRVAAVEGSAGGLRVILLGDNPAASTDSRRFGPVSRAEISGRVLLRYWPDARRGRIPSAAAVIPRAVQPGHPPR
jgi:nickel-type superoxide dismutase maturation protease